MTPLAHLLGSWLIASVTTDNPRDRKLVTLAGILPDADGLGLIVDAANAVISGQEVSFQYYQHYHHYLLHGWPGAIAVATLLAGCARQKGRVLLAGLLTFHLHLLCDLIGSRGPRQRIYGRSLTASRLPVIQSGSGKDNGNWMAGRTDVCCSCFSWARSGSRPNAATLSWSWPGGAGMRCLWASYRSGAANWPGSRPRVEHSRSGNSPKLAGSLSGAGENSIARAPS